MINYFLRKTIYKEFDKESQDRLVQLNAKKYIIEILCMMFWVVIWIFPFTPLLIIDICEDVEFSMTTKIAIIAFMLICSVGILVFTKVFERAVFGFSHLLAERIYFLVCTTQGKAISKKEFKIIKQVKEMLYFYIATRKCKGYCYLICFDICKALKKGSMEFLAIKKFTPNDEEDRKDYTMHVLYVNNGWAFDTYNSCQYPIEELHKIWKAKICKTFNFDEISNKSYEEFMEENEPEIAKWAAENNCSIFWKDNNWNA